MTSAAVDGCVSVRLIQLPEHPITLVVREFLADDKDMDAALSRLRGALQEVVSACEIESRDDGIEFSDEL